MGRFSGPDYKDITYTIAEELAFERDLVTRITELEEACDNGDIKSEFIKDLITSYHRYGRLTIKQLPWMLRAWKVHCSEDKETAPAVRAVAGGEIEYNIRIPCDGKKVLALLDKGKEAGLKNPDINFMFPAPINNIPGIRVYLSGPQSSFPGAATVIIQETPENYDNNNYLATVFRDAPVRWSMVNAKDELIQRAIRALVENPVESAVSSGRQTGICMFCMRPLTHAVSLHHGYGPICADRYGLPWEGEKLEPNMDLEQGLDN